MHQRLTVGQKLPMSEKSTIQWFQIQWTSRQDAWPLILACINSYHECPMGVFKFSLYFNFFICKRIVNFPLCGRGQIHITWRKTRISSRASELESKYKVHLSINHSVSKYLLIIHWVPSIVPGPVGDIEKETKWSLSSLAANLVGEKIINMR